MHDGGWISASSPILSPGGGEGYPLKPVALASSYGFKDNQLRLLAKKVREEQKFFLGAWHGYFKNHR
jgi:hypothetical protein